MTGQYGAAIGKNLARFLWRQRAEPRQGLGCRGLGRAHERLRKARRHQLRQRQSGHDGCRCPVIVYARELDASEEQLYRALVAVESCHDPSEKRVSARLSAYCGATSAGAGAGAGICYLYGGRYDEICPHDRQRARHRLRHASATARRRAARRRSLQRSRRGCSACQMYRHDSQFYGGDGIVVKGVENTIRTVGSIGARRHARDRQRDHPPDDRGGNCQMKILVTGFTPFGGEQDQPLVGGGTPASQPHRGSRAHQA